jgi:predicted O-methyltransferase YrrM
MANPHQSSAVPPTAADTEDPFACFGAEVEDEGIKESRVEADEKKGQLEKSSDPVDDRRQITRDPLCGVLRYHRGTERSLLVYVENEVKSLDHRDSLAQDVLSCIDRYSLERHWMMHCGPGKIDHSSIDSHILHLTLPMKLSLLVKGKTLRDFMKECVAARNQPDHDPSSRLIIVELGTYCGYSAIVLAKALREDIVEHVFPLDFHIFTVEANAECVAVATRLIELAGMDECITVLLNEDLAPNSSDLINGLRRKIRERFHNPTSFSIDFLFLDHDKEQYLLDLQTLEGSGLIKKGTYVAADNVIFAHIDDYREYLESLAQRGIVQNKIVELDLEYSGPDLVDDRSQQDVRDGIGKSKRLIKSIC